MKELIHFVLLLTVIEFLCGIVLLNNRLRSLKHYFCHSFHPESSPDTSQLFSFELEANGLQTLFPTGTTFEQPPDFEWLDILLEPNDPMINLDNIHPDPLVSSSNSTSNNIRENDCLRFSFNTSPTSSADCHTRPFPNIPLTRGSRRKHQFRSFVYPSEDVVELVDDEAELSDEEQPLICAKRRMVVGDQSRAFLHNEDLINGRPVSFSTLPSNTVIVDA